MHKKWRRLLSKQQLDLKNEKSIKVDSADKAQSQKLVLKPKKKQKGKKPLI